MTRKMLSKRFLQLGVQIQLLCVLALSQER